MLARYAIHDCLLLAHEHLIYHWPVLFEVVRVDRLGWIRGFGEVRYIHFHFLLEQLSEVKQKLMCIMLFTGIELSFEKWGELFNLNGTSVRRYLRVLLDHFVQQLMTHFLLRFVTVRVEPELSYFYLFSMYQFRCSIDISICKIDIMKHRFRGFSMPAGDSVSFLLTIGMTGKVESLARVGPPP